MATLVNVHVDVFPAFVTVHHPAFEKSFHPAGQEERSYLKNERKQATVPTDDTKKWGPTH